MKNKRKSNHLIFNEMNPEAQNFGIFFKKNIEKSLELSKFNYLCKVFRKKRFNTYNKIMKTRVSNISISSTINSRNGGSIFCSDFTGRNIADTGSGGKDIIRD